MGVAKLVFERQASSSQAGLLTVQVLCFMLLQSRLVTAAMES
jgi:hypothetical protein